jgi:hypothetical protein
VTCFSPDELVSNEAVRGLCEELISTGQSWAQIARSVGFIRPRDGYADTKKLVRMLGVKSQLAPSGRRYTQRRIHYDNAVLIVRGLGRDPVDFDL